ncbi:hypothetical protein [Helicobacter bizzozeronii]|uniref:hypothetical protein n=1 Tax=Helicobacter bizzozeronii TaxID=56877 RepID=UPI000CF16EE0|nr:hypothetical protein [Helicobacter bizzozeronii]
MQATNERVCQVILGAVESVKDGIKELATEFKSSAEYSTELNQAQRQINTLEYNQKQLQDKVSALESEKEKNRQEVEKAKSNNATLRQKYIENKD